MNSSMRGKPAGITFPSLARLCSAVQAMALVLATLAAASAAAAPAHPLDPLTAEELKRMGDILKASDRFSPGTNFAWIALDEPPKSVVAAWRPGAPFPRRGYAAAIDYRQRKTYAVIVDLDAETIASVTDLGGLEPGITVEDTARALASVDTDPRIKAALIRRGFKIPGRVSEALPLLFESVGHDPSLAEEKGRLVRVLFHSDQTAFDENSPTVDGLGAVVDVFTGKIVQLEDEPGAPIVPVPHNVFDPAVRGTAPKLAPVEPAAPQRHNFTLDGNLVRWGPWRFRVGFNLREGLVLYEIGIEDHGKERPIAYRASLAEVLTDYGDPNRDWAWMEYFDEGAFGLGYSSSAVVPGREVPANAVMLPTVLPDPESAAFGRTLRDRLYLYERDGGNLAYHQQDGRALHARATELVVGFLATLGNYDYFLDWVFRADGSFAFEAELAGEILTRLSPAQQCGVCAALAADPGAAPRRIVASGDDASGTLVAPNLIGVDHQHWFVLRLDFDIDGPDNAVVENDMVRRPGDRFFGLAETVFAKASDAKRDMDDAAARSWTIYNPRSLDAVGRPAGYRIVPMENAMTTFAAAREAGPAGFTFHQFWVTPYREHELFADGWHPAQAGDDYRDTLDHYADASPIFDKDIVVWYALGHTHMPLMEDYPLMSDMKVSVGFRPDGFFGKNPALGSASE